MKPTILALAFLFAAQAQAASFDCNKATTSIELSICASSELSKLDDDMFQTYTKAYAINSEVKLSQRTWLKNTQQCKDANSIENCIKNSYLTRLDVLSSLISKESGWLGFQIVNLVKTTNGNGVLVGKVFQNSPAQSAGLKEGDVIYQINGKPFDDEESVLPAFKVRNGEIFLFELIDQNENISKLYIKATQVPSFIDEINDSDQLSKTESSTEQNKLKEDESLINSEKIDAEFLANQHSHQVENEATNALESSSEHDNNNSDSKPVGIIITVIIGSVLFASGIYYGRRKSRTTEKVLERDLENNAKKLIDEPAQVDTQSIQSDSIEAEPEPTKVPEPLIFVEPKTSIQLPIQKVNLESSISNNSTNKSKVEKIETTVITKSNVVSNHKIISDLPKTQNIQQSGFSKKEPQEQFNSPSFKYKLEIFEGDYSKLSVPLSYSTLANLISNVSDSDVNNDLYLLAANHPSAKVRESVAMKDNLSSDIVSILLKDTSITVLRLLVTSDAFKRHVKTADLSRLICMDKIVAHTIASNVDDFAFVSSKEVKEMILESKDPETRYLFE